MKIIKDQVFEGLLIATAWDKKHHVVKSCISTVDHEVRIFGDIMFNDFNEKSLFVRKVSKIARPLVLERLDITILLT